MKKTAMVLVLVAAPALALTPRPKSYNPFTKEPTRIERAVASEAPRAKTRSVADKIGMQEDGVVKNDTESSYRFQIDSFAGYLFKSQQVKLGLSPVLWHDSSMTWGINLDVADNLIGGSVTYTVPYAHVVRLKLGAGYGILVADDGRNLRAQGKSRDVFYLKGSIRLW